MKNDSPSMTATDSLSRKTPYDAPSPDAVGRVLGGSGMPGETWKTSAGPCRSRLGAG